MNIPDKAVLDVHDMMKILECSKSTFYSYVNKGSIPEDVILRLGSVLKFKTAKVKEWLGL